MAHAVDRDAARLAQPGVREWIDISATTAVFLPVPPCAQAEQEAPAAQALEGRAHLGQQGRVAERVAQDRMAELQPRVEGGQVGDGGEALEHVGLAELEMVGHPGRVDVPGD